MTLVELRSDDGGMELRNDWTFWSSFGSGEGVELDIVDEMRLLLDAAMLCIPIDGRA